VTSADKIEERKVEDTTPKKQELVKDKSADTLASADQDKSGLTLSPVRTPALMAFKNRNRLGASASPDKR
jgi:hypothetical protein